MATILAVLSIGGGYWWIFQEVQKEPPATRLFWQVDGTRAGRSIAKHYGIPISHVRGWGLVGNVSMGFADGDGYWDGTPEDRDRAMLIARADSDETRYEYSMRKLLAKFAEDGVDPQTWDGLIVGDIETYNMRLFTGVVRTPIERGVGYDEAGEAYVFSKEFIRRKKANWDEARIQAYINAHPYSEDTNNDGVKDSIRLNYETAIADHIRIIDKLKEDFPNARYGWYAFPHSTYWGDQVEFDRYVVGWDRALGDLGDSLDFFSPSAYDHYSGLGHVCFPDQPPDKCEDDDWQRTHARDRERWQRSIKFWLDMGQKHDKPVYVYTWHMFHNDGRCTKSGWYIPEVEYSDHLVQNLGRIWNNEQIDGFIMWGADRYYWRANDCYRTNMETQTGCTDDECFDVWVRRQQKTLCRVTLEAATSVWPLDELWIPASEPDDLDATSLTGAGTKEIEEGP